MSGSEPSKKMLWDVPSTDETKHDEIDYNEILNKMCKCEHPLWQHGFTNHGFGLDASSCTVCECLKFEES